MLILDQFSLYTHPGNLETGMWLRHLWYQLLDSKMSILFPFQSLAVANIEQIGKKIEKRDREVAEFDCLY